VGSGELELVVFKGLRPFRRPPFGSRCGSVGSIQKSLEPKPIPNLKRPEDD